MHNFNVAHVKHSNSKQNIFSFEKCYIRSI